MKHYVSKFIHKDHNEIFYIKRGDFSKYWIAEVVKPDGYSSELRMSHDDKFEFEGKLLKKGWCQV
jgi:hypothetical protein